MIGLCLLLIYAEFNLAAERVSEHDPSLIIETTTPKANRSPTTSSKNLTAIQRSLHDAGRKAFREIFTAAKGLGPLFNERSCNSCHPGLRRGDPSTKIVRFGRASAGGNFNYMYHRGGPQLQARAIVGFVPEQLPTDVNVVSERIGPMLLGLGLIEAIPGETLLSYADPNDRNHDGISGRASFVEPPEYLELVDKVERDGKYLGRFGRKGASVNLLHQTVAAFFLDMGIASKFEWSFISDSLNGHHVRRYTPAPEIPAETVMSIVFHLQTLQPPSRRNQDNPVVLRGEKVFTEIECTACHVPKMQTGKSDIPELAFKTVALYSDLLLHDMGSKLADGYPEGEASGMEWRTSPLWGLGSTVNTPESKAYYLHDGRTSDLSEAIRQHGGEAERARKRFLQLDRAERASLIAFLKSL